MLERIKIGIVIPTTTPELGGTHVLNEAISKFLIESLDAGARTEVVYVTHGASRLRRRKKLEAVVDPLSGVMQVHMGLNKRSRAGKILLLLIRSRIRQFREPWTALNSSSALGQLVSQDLEKLSIDVVWFPSPAPFPIELPFVTSVYDLAHVELPWLPEIAHGEVWASRENYYREVLGRASGVIVSSQHTQRLARTYVPQTVNKIAVLPYPVPSDVPRNAHRPGFGAGAHKYGRFFLYPAQFWPHKNHGVLVEALALLRHRGHDVSLVFPGSDKGAKGTIERGVNRLDLSNKVHFLGFVARNELLDLYEGAQALLMPTLIGPDTLPVLEAFQVGCPVIAGNSMGMGEWVGDCGLVVDATIPSDWCEAMQVVLEGGPRVREDVARGLSRAKGLSVDGYVAGALCLASSVGAREKLGSAWTKPAD